MTTNDFQMTPPGSPTSVIFGTGITAAAPGAAGPLMLAVTDIDAARAELVDRGIDVSELFHSSGFDLNGPREPGPDPERKCYSTFAAFDDPDGDRWLLQELTSRLPGR